MIEATTQSFVYEIDAESSEEVITRISELFGKMQLSVIEHNASISEVELIEANYRAEFGLLALREAVQELDDELRAMVFAIVEDLVCHTQDEAVAATNTSFARGERMRAGKRKKAQAGNAILNALIDAGTPAKAVVAEASKQGVKIDVSNVYKRQKIRRSCNSATECHGALERVPPIRP